MTKRANSHKSLNLWRILKKVGVHGEFGNVGGYLVKNKIIWGYLAKNLLIISVLPIIRKFGGYLVNQIRCKGNKSIQN